jgi:hypothetical protein
LKRERGGESEREREREKERIIPRRRVGEEGGRGKREEGRGKRRKEGV